jgi:hypothetical protein
MLVLTGNRCSINSVINTNTASKHWLLTPWPQSSSELYRPSDRRLSAKLVTNFADRGCHVVSVTEPYGRNLGFLDRALVINAWHNFPERLCAVMTRDKGRSFQTRASKMNWVFHVSALYIFETISDKTRKSSCCLKSIRKAWWIELYVPETSREERRVMMKRKWPEKPVQTRRK